jgi:multimeric flavodoxin WrbA
MGSPRKGNTSMHVKCSESTWSRRFRFNIEYVWLKDLNLHPCRAVFSCFTKGEQACPIQNDPFRISDGVSHE